MLSALYIAQVVVGIAILYWGAEWLIRGSASIARAFGVKPLVVGLTVVAYGTSAPELAVATETALTHHQPIALGTVIGSCAANISLILGLTALISPPTIDGRLIRREVPILLGSAIAVPLLHRNGLLSKLEGGILIGNAVPSEITVRPSMRSPICSSCARPRPPRTNMFEPTTSSTRPISVIS
ncbi:MAG TPA: hypothetical protein VM513_25700, partial [Kofleriaceae bacterium]|nr:hypothetical protein [Kofleriaceae bacterium]